MDGRLINRYYNVRNNKIFMMWILRTKDGKDCIETPCDLRPYCYAPAFMKSEILRVAKDDWNLEFKIENDLFFAIPEYHEYAVMEVSVNFPYYIKGKKSGLRNAFEGSPLYRFLQEADVKYDRRVAIDYKVGSFVHINLKKLSFSAIKDQKIVGALPKLRILWLDGEWGDKDGPGEIGEKRMLSIATIDDETMKETWICNKNEKKLLEEFKEHSKKYDILIAYNGDAADFEQIKLRMKKKKVKVPAWRHFQFVDYMKTVSLRHRTFAGKKYIKLELLTTMFLGKSKKETKGSFYDMFCDYVDNGDTTLKEYNMEDVRLMIELDRLFKFIPINISTAEAIGGPLEICNYATSPSELGLFRLSKQHGLVWPSRPCDEVVQARTTFRGSTVISPEPGLHVITIIFDWVSLYNRIVQTFELCPSRYNSKTKRFDSNRIGVFPIQIESWEKDRNEFKRLKREAKTARVENAFDAMQAGIKILLLAVWGLTGQRISRFYCREVAEEITYWGRVFLEGDEEKGIVGIIEIIEAFIPLEGITLKVISGDTDSAMVSVLCERSLSNEELEFIAKCINKEVNDHTNRFLKSFGISASRRRMEMEIQGIYIPYLTTEVKKRHAEILHYTPDKGWLDRPKISFKGFELVRFDREKFMRELQKAVLMRVMRFEPIKEILASVKEIRKSFKKGEYNDMLVISMGTQKLDSYKNLSAPHVRVATMLNEMGLYTDYQTVDYIYTRDDKGLEVTPIIDGVIPEIHPTGLARYWDRALSAISKIFLLFITEEELNDAIGPLTIKSGKFVERKKLELFM